MDISFYGANCLTITTKQGRFVIDDNLASLGQPSIIKAGDIALYTSRDYDAPKVSPQLIINSPGEYEVAGVSIYGIAARSHLDEASKKSAIVYKFVTEDMRLLVLGHVYPELSESQLEQIGAADIVVVPVGGNGYTLDAIGALALIKKIEPKLIIPTHYEDKALSYEVPQQSLEEALKNLTMELKETVTRLRVKPTDLSDTAQLVVLERV